MRIRLIILPGGTHNLNIREGSTIGRVVELSKELHEKLEQHKNRGVCNKRYSFIVLKEDGAEYDYYVYQKDEDFSKVFKVELEDGDTLLYSMIFGD